MDIPFSKINKRGIPVLFYSYTIDTQVFEDNMERSEQARKDFYEKIEKGKLPNTSQLNTAEYEEFFRKLLPDGDILHITLGTGMTSSYNNALSAAENLKDEFPDRKIEIVNSLCSCTGYGMLVEAAADLRDTGADIKAITDYLYEIRGKIHHQFFSTNMKHFKRSGRVSGPVATVASVLNICPIMHLDADGKIVAYSKVRGKNNAILKTVSEMKEYADNGEKYSGKCYISHSNCYEDAVKTKNEIEKEFPFLKNRVVIYNIGTIIASHCGPGTVAVFFFGKEREN